MKSTFEIVERRATAAPFKAAISGAHAWSYRRLYESAAALAAALRRERLRVVGLAADNGPAWIVADLAAQLARVTLVPLPPYFSPAQNRHALQDSGADGVLADEAHGQSALDSLAPAETTLALPAGVHLRRLRAAAPESRLPAGTAKISYTSGTTGSPKGVCLSQTALDSVAQSLWSATADLGLDKHLCLLPLATLLENVAGVYAPLRNGAQIACPPLHEIGWTGSVGLDVQRLVACVAHHRPHSLILLPQILAALVAAIEAGAPRLETLRFAAVGGARVPRALLDRASELGLPVYEGYGLTECASVVALNTPTAHRAGSVGRVLAHAAVRIDEHSEIHVSGAATSCYVGSQYGLPEAVPTGDLGHIDADGYLHVTGRRKNVFITSFGRNVSPDWVEAELTRAAPIVQAAVFGESRPWNVAVVVPSRMDAGPRDIQRAVDAVNAELPDYARVHEWIRADEPFTTMNGLATSNGRNRRAAIWNRYGARIDACYCDTLAS